MRRELNLLTAILLLFSVACSGRSVSDNTRQGGLETGMVIPDVRCTSYPSYSYAVYLPKGYKEGSKATVFLAFDPGGHGTFPVNRYKDLAEKYGFILMGSNDSRNGLPIEQVGRIADALFSEMTTRFHADSTRIYLTGFSGGARVSCFTGMFSHKVRGVIGCGAGLPESTRQHQWTFDYFVLTGEADPNLSEVILQDQELTQAGWKHQLMVIPGGHAWPPVAMMEKAVLWMRGELPSIPQPTVSLSTYYEIDKEAGIQAEIISRFLTGDTLWMKKEIRRLQSQTERPKTRNDSLMAKRVIAFLGLMSWSNATAQLNRDLLDQAYRSLTIYRMVEQENPAVDSLFKVYYQKRKH